MSAKVQEVLLVPADIAHAIEPRTPEIPRCVRRLETSLFRTQNWLRFRRLVTPPRRCVSEPNMERAGPFIRVSAVIAWQHGTETDKSNPWQSQRWLVSQFGFTQ